jgi:hypothetical protein
MERGGVDRCVGMHGELERVFHIVFTRLSENAPDLEFRKQFAWSAPSFVWAMPSVNVGLAFAADEAVAQYRIENITPCVCRK